MELARGCGLNEIGRRILRSKSPVHIIQHGEGHHEICRRKFQDQISGEGAEWLRISNTAGGPGHKYKLLINVGIYRKFVGEYGLAFILATPEPFGRSSHGMAQLLTGFSMPQVRREGEQALRFYILFLLGFMCLSMPLLNVAYMKRDTVKMALHQSSAMLDTMLLHFHLRSGLGAGHGSRFLNAKRAENVIEAIRMLQHLLSLVK